MSYCVNCGVELAESEHACPLCHTEVLNPAQPFDRKAPRPFPSRLDLFTPSNNRGFIAAIVTLVLALPAAICLACDIAYTEGAGWSMLVVGAMAMLWVFIVPTLYIRRHRVLFGVVLDTGAVLGYLFLVERFAAHGDWFVRLAVPVVLLILLLFVADYLLSTKVVRGRFRQVALALALSPLLLVGIELAVNQFLKGAWQLTWSLIVSVPCLILALLVLVLDRRQRVKEEMRKRLHM